ncbi:hypothetical protein CEXT_414591 [Caerostris extrusa]|uniref:Uncharacterized protein n=1 Tax=Caerostris extrusa TaxID=172846 RepID=A0AAV4VVN1_CAEEX|nr:hypothetical protein CEXT_414591 [Caerostris extrusa]
MNGIIKASWFEVLNAASKRKENVKIVVEIRLFICCSGAVEEGVPGSDVNISNGIVNENILFVVDSSDAVEEEVTGSDVNISNGFVNEKILFGL